MILWIAIVGFLFLTGPVWAQPFVNLQLQRVKTWPARGDGVLWAL